MSKKKIAIYLPDLSKIGGGAEVYVLYLATILSKRYTITIFTKSVNLGKYPSIEEIYKHYNVSGFETIHLNNYLGEVYALKLLDNIKSVKQLNKLISDKFDIYIYGASSRLEGVKKVKSVQIVHFPDKSYKTDYPIIGTIFDKKYINSYHAFIVNSFFTKRYLKEYWNVDGNVLYPPISMRSISESELNCKENVILTVGRLVSEKKIIYLIEAFKQLVDKYHVDYQFIICGNKGEESEYIDKINSEIKGYPISVYSNVPYDELVSLYKKSKIYWHAMGYLESDDNPSKMEHFGMTTVEAMCNGCIPVVINKAGQKEIIGNDQYGFVWDSLDDLVDKTVEIINAPKDIHNKQEIAIKRANKYQMESFEKNVWKIFDNI